MKFVSGTTPEEKRLVLALQERVGAVADNSIGPQTLVEIASALGVDVWPLNITIFGQPVIVAEDILPAAVDAPLKAYANAISGSFSYNRRPCSILVAHGKVVCGYACHAHLRKPETVLYRLENGAVGVQKARYATELPQAVRWAVGGVGLLTDWNPAEEGFTGAYSDVLRRTGHTFVGTKRGLLYLGYFHGTGAELNEHCKKLGLERAIMLDGGHVAAINGAESKINTGQRQFFIVQAVQEGKT